MVARVEGLGRAVTPAEQSSGVTDGRYRLCSAVPDYAGSATEPSDLWLPYLSGDLPDLLAEQLSAEGGVADQGASVQLTLVDVDDALTAAVQPDAAPIAQLGGAVTASATTIFMRSTADASALTSGSVIYVDGEALRVDSVPGSSGSSSVDVTRGALGTDSTPHADAPVYAALPLLGGLRVTLSLGPLDGDSVADEQPLGEYVIDGVAWDEPINAWIIKARSQAEQLDATLPADPHVRDVALTADTADISGDVVINYDIGDGPADYFPDGGVSLYITESEEVLRGTKVSGMALVRVEAADRGLMGSDLTEDVYVTARRVLTAGDFRFSPATASTSRSSGTWTESEHPIDIALCLLASSTTETDGLELVNYSTGYPNYSALPVGYGAGVLASDIDWDEWLDVRARLGGLRLGNVVYGAESMTAREWLDTHILKPLGLHLVVAGGKLRPVLARQPLANAATTTITADDVLMRDSAQPDLDVTREVVGRATSVVYELGPQGVTATAVAGNYTRARTELRQAVPWASTDAGQILLWQSRAVVRTRQSYRPRTQLSVALDAAQWDLQVGDLAAVTLPEVPDLRGSRGLTGAAAQVEYREPRLDTDRGVWLQDVLSVYPADQLAKRIAPAAWVSSVSTNTATVLANRYTESDPVGGLPTSDAAAFAVGDVVQLVDPDGTSAGGTTQKVTAVGANTISLDGSFGGNLVADTVIIYAGYDDATATQTAGYAYCAESDQLVGTSDGDPTYYGEA